MKNNNFFPKHLITGLCILFLLCSFSSCKKKFEKQQNPFSAWNPDDGCMAVVFGEGYNEENFIAGTVELLSQKYGLEKDDGLIWPVIFPDDFLVAGKLRISSFPALLSEKKLCGLIIIGAPEKLNISLNKIRERMDEPDANVYPVYSLFSQDDVLGTEAGSELVFDFMMNNLGDENSLKEEVSNPYMDDVPNLLIDTVSSLLSYKIQKESGLTNSEIAQNTFSSQWQVQPYYDAESGLRSYNHFVISKIIQEQVSENE
jgi:hypothetical protein